MKKPSQTSLLIPVLRAPRRDAFLPPAKARLISLGSFLENLHQSDPSVCRTVESASVYAVDDDEELTELYTLLLEDAGYKVRVFNHRSKALAALKTEVNKPSLLITDYFGLSMHVHQFMYACRMVHPGLRILMASGISQPDAGFSLVRPDRFIGKPFTPDELLEEVRAALAA